MAFEVLAGAFNADGVDGRAGVQSGEFQDEWLGDGRAFRGDGFEREWAVLRGCGGATEGEEQ